MLPALYRDFRNETHARRVRIHGGNSLAVGTDQGGSPMQASLAHNHIFGFGEETCEVCGAPFTSHESESCPGVSPESKIGIGATPRAAPRRISRPSITGFLRAYLLANHSGKPAIED